MLLKKHSEQNLFKEKFLVFVDTVPATSSAKETFSIQVETHLTMADTAATMYENQAPLRYFKPTAIKADWLKPLQNAFLLYKDRLTKEPARKKAALKADMVKKMAARVKKLSRYISRATNNNYNVADGKVKDTVDKMKEALFSAMTPQQKIKIRFSQVKKFATKFENYEKQNPPVYYTWGNLGDGWIPLIEETIAIYKGWMKSNPKKRATIKANMLKNLKPQLARLKRYVTRADRYHKAKDVGSWADIKKFDRALT